MTIQGTIRDHTSAERAARQTEKNYMQLLRLTGILLILSTSGALADPVLNAAYSLMQDKDQVTLDANKEYKTHTNFPCNDSSSGCFQDKTFKQLDNCRYEMDIQIKLSSNYSIKQESIYNFKLARWAEMSRNADGKPTGYKIHGVGDFVCHSGTDDNGCVNEYLAGTNNVSDPANQLDHARGQLDIMQKACR